MRQMKTHSLLLLNCWMFDYNVIKNYLILFSNIDIVFPHSKELTVQCTQTGKNNVCVTDCRFAGLCERKFSVQNQPLTEQSVLPFF